MKDQQFGPDTPMSERDITFYLAGISAGIGNGLTIHKCTKDGYTTTSGLNADADDLIVRFSSTEPYVVECVFRMSRTTYTLEHATGMVKALLRAYDMYAEAKGISQIEGLPLAEVAKALQMRSEFSTVIMMEIARWEKENGMLPPFNLDACCLLKDSEEDIENGIPALKKGDFLIRISVPNLNEYGHIPVRGNDMLNDNEIDSLPQRVADMVYVLTERSTLLN